MAIDYGCTGPVLRGSGVDHDLRRDGEERYTEMYDGYAFEVIVRAERPLSQGSRLSAGAAAKPCSATVGIGSTCGCWKSCKSIDLVRQAIDRYSTATGSWGEPVKLTEKLPKGEAYLETECPARPDGLLHRQRRQRRFPGASGPAAVRFCNLSVTHELCRGCLIADVPAIVGSLDIVMGEIDR